jgi:hypothetical protein
MKYFVWFGYGWRMERGVGICQTGNDGSRIEVKEMLMTAVG